MNEMIDYMAEIQDELEQMRNKDSHLSSLQQQIDETVKDAYLEAMNLHELRKKSAHSLTKEIHQELKDLYLENAQFSISFNTEGMDHEFNGDIQLHKNGIDQIKFLISTNPGEPLKEINKVASGGELSRIMLAMKKILAKHQGVTSVIFDEVDTGVSGRVAQSMAEKIFQISIESQVLCITHLPQVAAMADDHKLIVKTEYKERTKTTERDLTKKEIVEERSEERR